MSNLSPVEFLVVGHMTKDVVPGGFRLGGTATFAALTAQRLGWHAGILTRIGADVTLPEELDGVTVCRLLDQHTTTFENTYHDATRQQFIREVAGSMGLSDIPHVWNGTKVVLLGPVADEVDPQLVKHFPDALRGIVPQGWMRMWDEDRQVRYRRWASAEEVLPRVHLLVLSEEDVQDELHLLADYASRVEVMVVTKGERGATVRWQGQEHPIPARTAQEVDPTGAGDVFTAAFLIRWHETSDPLQAARFASVVASFSVEGPGISAIPSRSQVEAWLATHPVAQNKEQ